MQQWNLQQFLNVSTNKWEQCGLQLTLCIWRLLMCSVRPINLSSPSNWAVYISVVINEKKPDINTNECNNHKHRRIYEHKKVSITLQGGKIIKLQMIPISLQERRRHLLSWIVGRYMKKLQENTYLSHKFAAKSRDKKEFERWEFEFGGLGFVCCSCWRVNWDLNLNPSLDSGVVASRATKLRKKQNGLETPAAECPSNWGRLHKINIINTEIHRQAAHVLVRTPQYDKSCTVGTLMKLDCL